VHDTTSTYTGGCVSVEMTAAVVAVVVGPEAVQKLRHGALRSAST